MRQWPVKQNTVSGKQPGGCQISGDAKKRQHGQRGKRAVTGGARRGGLARRPEPAEYGSWRAQKINETRVMPAGKPPDQPECDQRENCQTRPFMQLHPARFRCHDARHNSGHKPPMEQAQRQVPDRQMTLASSCVLGL